VTREWTTQTFRLRSTGSAGRDGHHTSYRRCNQSRFGAGTETPFQVEAVSSVHRVSASACVSGSSYEGTPEASCCWNSQSDPAATASCSTQTAICCYSASAGWICNARTSEAGCYCIGSVCPASQAALCARAPVVCWQSGGCGSIGRSRYSTCSATKSKRHVLRAASSGCRQSVTL